jgi:hypothetical protein
MINEKESDTAGRQEKKPHVLSVRVGDTVFSQLSGHSASGKRLSAAQAARHILEEALNGHRVPAGIHGKGGPTAKPEILQNGNAKGTGSPAIKGVANAPATLIEVTDLKVFGG